MGFQFLQRSGVRNRMVVALFAVSCLGDVRDSVLLRFRVEEVVDLELEEPEITFEISKFDESGLAQIRRDSSYRILSNCDSPRRLVAALNVPLPLGTSLELELQPPETGVASTGSRPLGLDPVELLNGLGKVNRSGVALAYTFRAEISANVGSVSPSITFSVIP